MIGKTLMPIGKQGYCKPWTVFISLSCTIMIGLFKIQIDLTKRCSQMLIAAFIHNSVLYIYPHHGLLGNKRTKLVKHKTSNPSKELQPSGKSQSKRLPCMIPFM